MRLARRLAAAGAADDLREQLKRPLRRAEIRQAEADVGRDDADERHRRKVVPLGDHLRADEDVDRRRARRRAARARSRRAGGSCRDRRARSRAPGNARAQVGLEPLGAEAGLLEVLAAAGAASRAAPPPRSCSSGTARAAARGGTSATTLQCGHSIDAPHCRQKTTRREAAPVEQHQRLLAAGRADRRSPRAAAR